MMAPDLSNLTPKDAKNILKEFFVKQIMQSSIHSRGISNYTFADAFLTIHKDNIWAERIAYECFNEAVKECDEKFPICWDDVEKKFVR